MPFVLKCKNSNYSSVMKAIERIMPYGSNQSSCTHLIIPGVSSFDASLASFYDAKNNDLSSYSHILGVCAGAQILFESSEEGQERGLGLLKGRVAEIKASSKIRVPHLGWNNIVVNEKHPMVHLLKGIDLGKKFYFSHSYHFPESEDTLAYVEYGERFPVIVARDKAVAVQFHPEKSYNQGLQLLKNFCDL